MNLGGSLVKYENRNEHERYLCKIKTEGNSERQREKVCAQEVARLKFKADLCAEEQTSSLLPLRR